MATFTIAISSSSVDAASLPMLCWRIDRAHSLAIRFSSSAFMVFVSLSPALRAGRCDRDNAAIFTQHDVVFAHGLPGIADFFNEIVHAADQVVILNRFCICLHSFRRRFRLLSEYHSGSGRRFRLALNNSDAKKAAADSSTKAL